jgi:dTDP-4-amino-4,6-dideoxygalactose transaminase
MASITPIALKDGAAPWRFNAEVTPGKRDSVFRKLLESGVKASTWYPRMTEFLPAHAFRSTDLPVAKRFEQALLNLWVDDTTTDQDITQTCSTLKHALLDPENQQRLTAS